MSIHDLIIQHVNAHQQNSNNSNNDDGSGASIEACIQTVEQSVTEWKLSHEMNQLSLKKKGGTSRSRATGSNASGTGTSVSDQVAETVLFIYDCVLLSEAAIAGAGAADNDSMLRILLGIATVFGVKDVLIQRAQQALQAPLDRLRVCGCHLLAAAAAASPSTPKTTDHTHDKNDDIIHYSEHILPRLMDKAQSVRLAAIQAGVTILSAVASNSNNNNNNNNNNITTNHTIVQLHDAMIWNLHHDPSFNNRLEALSAFSSNHDGTADADADHVILRLRDVKSKVRVQAVHILTQHYAFQQLNSQQCAAIVRAGLTDRCKETSDATTTLICTRWIKAAKYDPVALLAHLQPVLYETECEKVIQTLLKVSSTSEDYLKDISDAEIRAFVKGMSTLPTFHEKGFNPESILFARLLCEHQTIERTKLELLANVLVDIPMLCDAIQMCLQKLAELVEEHDFEQEEEAQIFVCNQLFKLAQLMDLQEEGSRRHYKDACKSLLASIQTPEELLEEACKAMMHDSDSNYFETITEIITTLAAAATADTTEGEEAETKELVQLRMVSILTIVLEHASPHHSNNAFIKSFIPSVLPAITSENAMLREAGVSCLGRLSLLLPDPMEFQALFLEILKNDNEKVEIRAQAMLALSDLTMIFSTDDSEDDDNLKSFLLVVSNMLHSSPSVVAVAAEVATKLLFAGKAKDSELIASLLVVFFNKAYENYEEEDNGNSNDIGSVHRMQQLLSLFFPAYSMKSGDHKTLLVNAISPMLQLLTHCRTSGSQICKMIEFVYATAEVGQDEQSSCSQAVAVCLQLSTFLLLSHDTLTNSILRTLCKLLGGADVDPATCDKRDAFKLKDQVNELTIFITDEQALESLETMVELLEDVAPPIEDVPVVADEDDSSVVGQDCGNDDEETETEDEEEQLVTVIKQIELTTTTERRRRPLAAVN